MNNKSKYSTKKNKGKSSEREPDEAYNSEEDYAESSEDSASAIDSFDESGYDEEYSNKSGSNSSNSSDGLSDYNTISDDEFGDDDSNAPDSASEYEEYDDQEGGEEEEHDDSEEDDETGDEDDVDEEDVDEEEIEGDDGVDGEDGDEDANFGGESKTCYLKKVDRDIIVLDEDDSTKYGKLEYKKIPDDKRISDPVMTYYEMTRVIGVRAQQFNFGAKILLQDVPNIHPAKKAYLELLAGMTPYIIRRHFPGKRYEEWRIDELEIIHEITDEFFVPKNFDPESFIRQNKKSKSKK